MRMIKVFESRQTVGPDQIEGAVNAFFENHQRARLLNFTRFPASSPTAGPLYDYIAVIGYEDGRPYRGSQHA